MMEAHDVLAIVDCPRQVGVQQLQDGTPWRYRPEGFLAMGRVGGRSVSCLSAEVQILCHIGYAPDERDHHDMRRLAERFGIGLPEPYQMSPKC